MDTNRLAYVVWVTKPAGDQGLQDHADYRMKPE